MPESERNGEAAHAKSAREWGRSWPLRESLRVSGERTNCFCFLFGDVQGSLRIAPAMEGRDFRPSKTNGILFHKSITAANLEVAMERRVAKLVWIEDFLAGVAPKATWVVQP